MTLTAEERIELEGMLGNGKSDARKLTHARILLQADAGPARTDEPVVAGLDLSNWPFTTADARVKLRKLHPTTDA